MLVKNDVLSEFKNVRSYERLDLLCSLLDLCLPYELRFLGTCLEFLGKRDFYELREDERDANNVNHVSSFRSLMDENTRRKLVLYVSLLKSCNSDCANCLNETLTALCIDDVNQICRAEPENAEKVLDELLLLYTIAVKHPAFNLHQKTEFAAHLARLEEEDLRLSSILYPNEGGTTKNSRLFDILDSIPETPCRPRDSSISSSDTQDNSSQISVISNANQFTCPVLSGSVYTSAVLPSALHQASCLHPAHVMVSSIPSPQTEGQASDTASRLNTETGHSVITVGLAASPGNSNLIAGPGPGPGPGLVVPLSSSTSHCIMSNSGDIGMQKGSLAPPNIIAPMMCVPPESIPMPYPGPGPYGMMVPLVGPIPGPPMGCPPSSMAPTLTGPALMSVNKPVTSSSFTAPPVPAPCSISTPKLVPVSCSSYDFSSPTPTSVSSCSSCTSSPSSAAKESSKSEDEGRLDSLPPSPSPAKTSTPPPTPKVQVLTSKNLQTGQLSHHMGQNQPSQAFLQSQPPYQILPNVYPNPQQPLPAVAQLSSSKANSHIVNQVPAYQNQIISVGSIPTPQPLPQTSKPSGQWYPPGDNLKEAIVREMPKYKANLQDLSPDELLHMGDEQLKEIGLSQSAIQQLRSIMNKLHSTNGISCVSRSDAGSQNESSNPRRRHYYSPDNKGTTTVIQGHPPGSVPYSYVVPLPYSGNTNNGASNGSPSFHKGNKRHQPLQITNQVRALHLEDDSRRPCSNSSSTSECSSGSHSPPETPSLPLISEVPVDLYDRGFCGKDSWNSTISEEKLKDDRLQEGGHIDDRSRSGYQHPGIQRNTLNSRSRGLSKAPPGIPTMPRGRGHPMADKTRRDPSSSLNGVPPCEINSTPPPYAMTGASGLPSNVAYPAPPVSSFLPHTPFTSMHAFHRFQSGSFLPAGSGYPFPPNGELWSPFHQPPQPTPPYITTPIVAFSPAHPPPKVSCYNCGRQGHQGSDCKESTFEEITQQGQYHLDYKPGDCRDTDK